MCSISLFFFFCKPTCVCSWVWTSSSSETRAALSVNMACCCCRESCSWTFCSSTPRQIRVALRSFSCRERVWETGRPRLSKRGNKGETTAWPLGTAHHFNLLLLLNLGQQIVHNEITLNKLHFVCRATIMVAQTLDADCSACSLKVCSNSSIWLTSSCFSWSSNSILWNKKKE